ncbi:MAG: nucleoside-diphosphate kinase [Candidatus Pacebacteria bacterium]|nr:nucleoside-diphosphate kinase [Candidatus Paceibacterota bacterium]
MKNMNHPKKEQSLVILKPDTIQRSLIGELISRIERTGLKITALKMVVAKEDMLWKHYNKDEKWFQEKGGKLVENRKAKDLPIEKEAIEYGRDIIEALVNFMSCSPVVVMIIEGNQAVSIVKKIVGGTEPTTSDVGTIRGDLTLDSYELANMDSRAIRNLIHCSDHPDEAQREISLWFKPEEIMNYSLIVEKMLYDVNLDGLKE